MLQQPPLVDKSVFVQMNLEIKFWTGFVDIRDNHHTGADHFFGGHMDF
jgi:hypothetical protein